MRNLHENKWISGNVTLTTEIRNVCFASNTQDVVVENLGQNF